jgi:nucleoside-diphosphate-sugar epimerase
MYCIGVSSDFRTRPLDTVDAHVSALVPLLRSAQFESFTYLSSTRLYHGVKADIAREDLPLTIQPGNPDDLYNASKIAGESVCLALDNPAIRVVRLSNVYGEEDRSGNFLTVILQQILAGGNATFFTSLTSEKDYVSIEDIVRSLELVPLCASSRVLNLANGRNVSNAEIAEMIRHETGRIVRVRENAPDWRFPRIAVDRMVNELGLRPRDLPDTFPMLVAGLRNRRGR